MKSIEQQILEKELVEETKILQKINAHHRLGFREKFPAQSEHILRLIAERLQLGLDKRNDLQLTNEEVFHLSQSLHSVYEIYKEQK